MNIHAAVRTGLNKGLFGLCEQFLNEYLAENDILPMTNKRMRLSIKFRPLMDLVLNRVLDTKNYKRDHGLTNEDKTFSAQAACFLHMFDICKDIMEGTHPEYSSSSTWLTYLGSPSTSPYFTLEICSKDGRQVASSLTIRNLLVSP